MESAAAVQITVVDTGIRLTQLHRAYELIDPCCLQIAKRVVGYAATHRVPAAVEYLVRTSRTMLMTPGFYAGTALGSWQQQHARATELGIEPTLLYLQLLSDQLESFLSGEQTGPQIIRAAGPALWERYNDQNLIASFLADAVADSVATHFLRLNSQAIQMLELGGGVGATTRRLQNLLNQFELVFTDIKPYFLARARALFGAQLRTRILDINAPDRIITTVAGQRFHVIYATNVLHCAYDPVATLTALRRILTPNGVIILGEGIVPTQHVDGPPWPLDVFFSLFPGWWDIPPSLMRLRPGCLTVVQWCQIFAAAGFQRVDVTLYADTRQYGAIYCAR